MTDQEFEKIVEERIGMCQVLLRAKGKEYGDGDRLHNFKAAAALQGCTPVRALFGMMVKHTVSLYDLGRRHEWGEYIPPDTWAEKIGDSINYLLLLTALLAEEAGGEGHKCGF